MSAYSDAEDAAVGAITAAARTALDSLVPAVIAEAQAEQAAQLQAALATAVKLQSDMDALQARYVAVQDALAAETAAFDAYKLTHPDPTPPPPPPPPAKPGIGVSVQGFTRDPSVAWDYGRTYSAADLKALNPKTVPVHSFSDILDVGGPKNWPSDAAKVAKVQAEMATLPDVPGVMLGFVHEFDNPSKYGTDVATFLKDEAAGAQMVRATQSKRKNPFLIYRCAMEYSLFVGNRNIMAFWTGDVDVQMWDAYIFTNAKRYDALLAAIATIGKPFGIGELGVRTQGSQPTDDEAVATMRMALDKFQAAKVLLWFDRKPLNTLDPTMPGGKPNGWALWKSQVAA